ncbi:hypothetical protein ANN_24812 [Periplaneta americana]|uniref:Uncharacterized protein n=1 Tax=Periplaneta americana TaxID=6978 RepID=A0ABQ8S001_PERAM|nr:hypothetical protein ANN_24812 [Periplaneta americana]
MELLVYDGKAEFHEGVRVGASVTYVHDGHDQLNNCITTASAYHVGDTGSNSSEPMPTDTIKEIDNESDNSQFSEYEILSVLCSAFKTGETSVNINEGVLPDNSNAKENRPENGLLQIRDCPSSVIDVDDPEEFVSATYSTSLHSSGKGKEKNLQAFHGNLTGKKNKFKATKRRHIFQAFWKTMTWEQRTVYVSNLVDFTPTKRSGSTNSESRRKRTFVYNLKVDEKKIQVCKKMFLCTLGIKE